MRNTYTVWLLSSLSLGVFALGAFAAILRRAWTIAASHYLDRRQDRAFERYQQQFAGCTLTEIPLEQLVDRDTPAVLRQLAGTYGQRALPRVLCITETLPGSPRPSAFTAFFYLDRPAIVVCPYAPEDLSPYQKFSLYHELGHTAGFQTTHSLWLAIAAGDSLLLLLAAVIAGFDHAWGFFVLAAYLPLRFIDPVRSRVDLASEIFADVWGYWGLEAEGCDADAIAAVRRQHALVLGDRPLASERIAGADQLEQHQRMLWAQRGRERAQLAQAGEPLNVTVEHKLGATATDTLEHVAASQRGPADSRTLGIGWLAITSLLLPAALGVALANVPLGWTLALAGGAITFIARQCLVAAFRAPSPQSNPD